MSGEQVVDGSHNVHEWQDTVGGSHGSAVGYSTVSVHMRVLPEGGWIPRLRCKSYGGNDFQASTAECLPRAAFMAALC